MTIQFSDALAVANQTGRCPRLPAYEVIEQVLLLGGRDGRVEMHTLNSSGAGRHLCYADNHVDAAAAAAAANNQSPLFDLSGDWRGRAAKLLAASGGSPITVVIGRIYEGSMDPRQRAEADEQMADISAKWAAMLR